MSETDQQPASPSHTPTPPGRRWSAAAPMAGVDPRSGRDGATHRGDDAQVRACGGRTARGRREVDPPTASTASPSTTSAAGTRRAGSRRREVDPPTASTASPSTTSAAGTRRAGSRRSAGGCGPGDRRARLGVADLAARTGRPRGPGLRAGGELGGADRAARHHRTDHPRRPPARPGTHRGRASVAHPAVTPDLAPSRKQQAIYTPPVALPAVGNHEA